jgi:hypothetical protein
MGDDHEFAFQRIGLKSGKEQGDFGEFLDHGKLLVQVSWHMPGSLNGLAACLLRR